MEMTSPLVQHAAFWIAGLLTIGIVSFLYRDNPFYKLCESIFVGISAGYWFVAYFWDNLYDKFWIGVTAPMADRPQDWYMLYVGAALGVMMIARLLPKVGWISRWPLAFIVGATAGLYLITYFASNVMVQVADTVRPLFGDNFSLGIAEGLSNIVVAIGTFAGLIYFFFSKEHKGAFGAAAKVGIFFLMVTFGASFGYTVMSRMSLLIGRIDFVLGDWLHMIN